MRNAFYIIPQDRWMIKMYERLINMSNDIFGIEPINELLMSDLYHDIAEQNYKAYHTYQNSFKSCVYKISSILDEIFNQNFESVSNNKKNISRFIKNYIQLDDTKSITELVKIYPNESIKNASLVFDIFYRSNNFDNLKNNIPNILEKEFDYKNLLKTGMTAIAFEAFACETLINQELQLYMDESVVKNYNKKNPNDKRPVYIQKLEKIMCEKSIKAEQKLISKIKYVMRSRNKIAHFNGFKLDMLEMLKYIELTYKYENKSKIYVCDVFKILDEPLEVYSNLKKLIKI